MVIKLLYLVISLMVFGCTQKTKPAAVAVFTLPEVPVIISDEERSAYLALHYWDNFDFADTTLLYNADVTEQAFVDFINLLPSIEYNKVDSAMTKLIRSAAADSVALSHFMEMTERYLYDPNSPFRNEEMYIPVLRAIIATSVLGDDYKIRPQYQLDMALKNRSGDVAADFTITLANGKQQRLSSIRSEYVILFFNNPDCHDCKRVKEYITNSGILNSDRITVFSAYTDKELEIWKKTFYPEKWINGYTAIEKDLYDLKAIPCLYLLDKDKRVILKDAPVERIEWWLAQQVN